MDFITTDQKWWCNPCLAFHDGAAPEGLAGPTAQERSAERAEQGQAVIRKDAVFFDQLLSVTGLVNLGLLGVGVALLVSGSMVLGGIFIGVSSLAFFLIL